MRILNITNIIRALAIVAAFACYGCIDVSSSTPPSTKTTCTPNADGTQTCTSQPTGGSHWGFFL
jgi:hypothetical protein